MDYLQHKITSWKVNEKTNIPSDYHTELVLLNTLFLLSHSKGNSRTSAVTTSHLALPDVPIAKAALLFTCALNSQSQLKMKTGCWLFPFLRISLSELEFGMCTTTINLFHKLRWIDSSYIWQQVVYFLCSLHVNTQSFRPNIILTELYDPARSPWIMSLSIPVMQLPVSSDIFDISARRTQHTSQLIPFFLPLTPTIFDPVCH